MARAGGRGQGLAPLVYEPSVVDGMHVVAYDPAGAGRIVEVFGDLTAAEHVAVIVPGNAHDLRTYRLHTGGASPRRNGRTLWRAMGRLAPAACAAVVVWLGYACPRGVAGLRADAARAGASDLRTFTTWLRPGVHTTLVGHSYGSVICAAAADGGRVDDLVALASPGLGATHAAALGATRVWVAWARGDWVRFVPSTRMGRFGHGRRPTPRRTGAIAFATDGAAGHSSYYTVGTECLSNIARITLGRYDEVTRARSRWTGQRDREPLVDAAFYPLP